MLCDCPSPPDAALCPVTVERDAALWRREDDMSTMQKMKCQICGHIYDPSKKRSDVEPGIAFGDLSDSWRCPVCGAEKKNFMEIA